MQRMLAIGLALIDVVILLHCMLILPRSFVALALILLFLIVAISNPNGFLENAGNIF